MGQKPSDGTKAANHPAASRSAAVTIARHNPATEQMLAVGKRREEAEAKLQQRLLKTKPAPEAPTE